MIEKPDISDDLLIATIIESYATEITGIAFMPVGYDASAWAYRLDCADGQRYFLKLKRGEISQASLAIPRFLHDQGIRQVVAPLANKMQQLSVPVDSYNIILYPFIDGSVAAESGLSEAQWTEFGRILKQVHRSELEATCATLLRREDFVPAWGKMVQRLDAMIVSSKFAEPYRIELAAFWHEKREEILTLLGRCQALAKLLQKRNLEFVLCHADIHLFNLLVGPDKALHIVDWDGLLLAPKERDLMFIESGDDSTNFGAKEEKLFMHGYGGGAIDRLALAYYRYEWVVQEIGDFGERVFLTPELGEETKADSVRGFRQLFQPGDVVEAAYWADATLAADQAD